MKSSTSFGFSSSLLFFFIVAASINVVYSEDAASIDVDSEIEVIEVSLPPSKIVEIEEIEGRCSYKLTVQTGDRPDAGTNSRISVTLGNSHGERIEISDLKQWGVMWYGHDYFEKGKRDSFSAVTFCFNSNTPVCNITVTSDGSGQKPGWFLGEVDVSQDLANPSYDIKFNFGQWLAKDEPPYKLTASVNKCG